MKSYQKWTELDYSGLFHDHLPGLLFFFVIVIISFDFSSHFLTGRPLSSKVIWRLYFYLSRMDEFSWLFFLSLGRCVCLSLLAGRWRRAHWVSLTVIRRISTCQPPSPPSPKETNFFVNNLKKNALKVNWPTSSNLTLKLYTTNRIQSN